MHVFLLLQHLLPPLPVGSSGNRRLSRQLTLLPQRLNPARRAFAELATGATAAGAGTRCQPHHMMLAPTTGSGLQHTFTITWSENTTTLSIITSDYSLGARDERHPAHTIHVRPVA